MSKPIYRIAIGTIDNAESITAETVEACHRLGVNLTQEGETFEQAADRIRKHASFFLTRSPKS